MRKSIFKKCSENYVNWVIRLGKVRSAILGIFVLGIFAILIQSILNYVFFGTVVAGDIFRSILFGLLSAPFVLYFFNVIVEQLERSRLKLERSVYELNVMRAQDAYLSAKLKQNSVDKTQLMATISHELRTPLNGIIGLSRMLLEEDLSQKQREYLQTINVSAVSLGYIFSDIIDLEKIDASRIELNRQPTDFPALLNDIYNFASFLAKQKKLIFSLELEPNLPNWLNLDRVRLSQILWNLISNAVKFTDQGNIILKIIRNQDCYHFIVKDTGMGISPEEQKHIFEMYYQVKESRQQSAGSGIGLAISKNLAQLMEGDLTVESERGKGATFHLTLHAQEISEKESVKKNIPSLNILLVEDVDLNIMVAKTILEKLGHHVDVATNGKQAITLFEKNVYDILLLDIKLPDMSGFEIAQYLRENYENGIYDFLPPMIAFTANVMQSEQEYLEMGMDGVLRKPISIKDLHHCLQQFFADESESIIEMNDDNEVSQQFDLALIETLGKSQILENLSLFKQTMPNYLAQLSKDNMKETEDTAHKIKGAAASVGLNHLRQLADALESAAKNFDIFNCGELIDEIGNQWLENVEDLAQFCKVEE